VPESRIRLNEHPPWLFPEPETPAAAPAESTRAVAASPEDDVPPPSRDELVAAWGDHVLSQLRPAEYGGVRACSQWAVPR